jgi:hypothetical protein
MRLALPLALAAGLSASAALAHHGWSWAEGEQIRLEGTVRQVTMSPPHPELRVAAADGAVWRVELGNPGLTARAGVTAEVAAPGTRLTVVGHRSRNRAERHMKAVRLVIAGRNYDIYPERILTN